MKEKITTQWPKEYISFSPTNSMFKFRLTRVYESGEVREAYYSRSELQRMSEKYDVACGKAIISLIQEAVE